MARRTLTTTAATLAATLLLSACGGGGDDSSDDIEGADKGSSSPSASASAAADVERPDVSLPGDLKLVFDFDKPSDADEAAALDDAANYIRALKHGIVAQDPNDAAYQFYSRGGAAKYAKTQIDAWVDGGWTATGEDRYYDAVTSKSDDAKAVLVTFCRNQAKSYSKNIETGKITYTKESLDSYLKYRVLMQPSVDSPQVWQARQIEVAGKAKECQQ
ncbi:hypothetical protein OHT76_25335 [Streptomyces sp. NBC_00287]|uniref:hypothetical protein n=1 Tax=Streptomyces sp. NBC_00287 TaxID=2975702 RepID=UPI002E2B19DF|nr:hypothetical protein [Streptomyces sp. NBC_00287]